MKKIAICMLSLLICLSLTACGTSAETTALNTLSNQLDRTSNTVSSIQEIDTDSLNPSEDEVAKITDSETLDRLTKNLDITKGSIDSETAYKDEILTRTAKIKNRLQDGDITLAKGQISAIKDLSSSLSKYNTNISYSSTEYNSTMKNYNNMKAKASQNSEKVSAKLNKLACNSNARCSYYENILNTLEQVEDVLGIEDEESVENYEQDGTNATFPPQNGAFPPPMRPENRPNSFIGRRNFRQPQFDMRAPFGNENNYNEPTENNEENEESVDSEESTQNGEDTQRNTDTYGPSRKNIDTFYNNYGVNGRYSYGNGGMFGGEMFGGIYRPYAYNSNNYNRLNNPYLGEQTELVTNIENEENTNITNPKTDLQQNNTTPNTSEVLKVEENNNNTNSETENNNQNENNNETNHHPNSRKNDHKSERSKAKMEKLKAEKRLEEFENAENTDNTKSTENIGNSQNTETDKNAKSTKDAESAISTTARNVTYFDENDKVVKAH